MEQDKMILAFNAGTRAGFTAIFNHFFQSLCYYANQMINDPDQAKDVAMTTLTAIFERHAMFEQFSKLQGYLYITVANKCRNIIRDRKRSNVISNDLDEEIPCNDTLANNIIMAEFLRDINNELHKLTPLRRRIIELFYLAGKSNTEICKLLGMRRTSVYTYKQRGIDQIKNILKLKKAYP